LKNGYWAPDIYWPPAEPLAGANGTLKFHGTPVVNHCFKDMIKYVFDRIK